MKQPIGARTFVLALAAIGVGCSSAVPKASDVCAAGGASGSFSWTTGQDCPLARFEANGVVAGGELWVMGGFTSARLDVTRRVDIYNPATDDLIGTVPIHGRLERGIGPLQIHNGANLGANVG